MSALVCSDKVDRKNEEESEFSSDCIFVHMSNSIFLIRVMQKIAIK